MLTEKQRSIIQKYFKHVSYSLLSQFEDCELKMFFRYLQGFKIPPPVAIVEGSVGHKGIETNYTQKVITSVDLPLDDVLDATWTEWRKQHKEIEDWEGEHPSKVEKRILATVKHYHRSFAPSVLPVAAEERIDTQMEGVNLLAFIDVEDDQAIHDTKFSKRKRQQNDVDTDLQLGIYSLIKNKRKVQFDCVIKDIEKPRVEVVQSFKDEVAWERIKYRVGSLLVRLASALNDGEFKRAPQGFFKCSKDFCGYWKICPQGEGEPRKIQFDVNNNLF